MAMHRIASLGLCAALLGAQPGCAHQLNDRDRNIVVIAGMVGLVVGALVLDSLSDQHCKGPATCGHADDTARRGAPDSRP